MKKLIIILTLLLLVGCGKECPTCEVCDYSTYLAQNTDLVNQNSKTTTQYTGCLADKEKVNSELSNQKLTNNKLKIQCMASNTTTTSVTSSTTCTRLLGNCEENLEECWLYNATTQTNCTENLEDCRDILELINESLK